MTRRSLRLECLEDRLTPATRIAVPILPPASTAHLAQQVAIVSYPTTGGQGSTGGITPAPMLGLPPGSSGSSGSSGGNGGLGSTTGDPIGPGPGN